VDADNIGPIDEAHRLNEVLGARKSSAKAELRALDDQMNLTQKHRFQLIEELRHIDALLGVENKGELERQPNDRETPTVISDAVVHLVKEQGPMHYREIFANLFERGLTDGSGADPENALLARYYNDPRLYRPARGTYAARDGKRVKSVGTRKRKVRRRR
jgi:hypothetical protein